MVNSENLVGVAIEKINEKFYKPDLDANYGFFALASHHLSILVPTEQDKGVYLRS